MRRMQLAAGSIAAAAAAAALIAGGQGGAEAGTPGTTTFSDPRTIDNPYLPLTRHQRCEHVGRTEDGTRTRSVVTVMPRTKRFEVGGATVDVAVLRDNAYEGGKLVESTLDYFAQGDDGAVYYFGEDVLNMKNGKVVDTKGTWLYGEDTDVLGVVMPAEPGLGDQFRPEDVPGITSESARVEETGMRYKAAGRVHTGVIRIQEFIQPEGDVEYKLYAPGVGRVVEYAPGESARLKGCR